MFCCLIRIKSGAAASFQRVLGHQQETLKINTGSSFPPLHHLGKKGKVEVAAWECCPVTSQGSQPKFQVQCTFFPVVCSQNSPERCLSLWGFPCTPGISSRDAPAPPEQQQIQKLRALIPVLEGVTVTCSSLAGQVQGFPCE